LAERAYRVYGAGAVVERDEITPFLAASMGAIPKDLASAAQSTAYEMQKVVKAFLRAGGGAGITIPPRKPLDAAGKRRVRRLARDKQAQALLRGGNKRFAGPGKRSLIRAIGYQKTPTGAVMGWLSKSAAYWGARVQEGGSKPVTDKQRRFMAAVGLPTKKTSIEQPRAMFFGDLMRRKKPEMARIFQRKLTERIARRIARAKGKGAA
jgi:hypothetical protein